MTKKLGACPLEEEKSHTEEKNGFCFLKGELVSCSSGRIQDCNTKRTKTCPLYK
jgi:hypothetical protein